MQFHHFVELSGFEIPHTFSFDSCTVFYTSYVRSHGVSKIGSRRQHNFLLNDRMFPKFSIWLDTNHDVFLEQCIEIIRHLDSKRRSKPNAF